ncbi:MAG TPA: hypothetical protein VM661_06940 [Candidatus Sulfotelmatobacter sp.]|jgi:hypothetical protein|nr:hypothetical protein [Candidatus Sulfotelmatobacter sp.]
MTIDLFPAHEPPIATIVAEPTKPTKAASRRRPRPPEGQQAFTTRKQFNRDFVAFNAALDEALGADSCLETGWPYSHYSDKETMREIVVQAREDVRAKRQAAGHS